MKEKICEIVKENIALIVIGIITFCVLLQSPQNIWLKSDTGIDSSVFKYIGWGMTKGAVPYRDMFDHKGIYIYIVNAIGVWLSKDCGVWFVELVSMFIAVYIMYRIARLFTTRNWSLLLVIVALCPMLTYFEGGNLVEEYALPFISYTLFCFIDYFLNRNITHIRLIFCGVSLAVVLFLRQNMIAVWVVFCLAVLVQQIKKREYKKLFEFILFFSLGAFFVVIPIILYLRINDAWKDFVYDYWIFNFLYTSTGSGSKWQAFFYFANSTVIISSFVLIIYNIGKKKESFNVVYGICMLVTLGTMALSGYTFAHYGMIMIPLLVYPFACIIKAKETRLILLVLLIFSVLPSWFAYIQTLDVKYTARNTECYDALTQEICSYIQQNTNEDDKITVYGNWNVIYLHSERFSATKYCYNVSTKMDEYFDELDKSKPAIVVMRNTSLDDQMNEWLEQNGYVLSHQVPEQALIYSRNDTGS